MTTYTVFTRYQRGPWEVHAKGLTRDEAEEAVADASLGRGVEAYTAPAEEAEADPYRWEVMEVTETGQLGECFDCGLTLDEAAAFLDDGDPGERIIRLMEGV